MFSLQTMGVKLALAAVILLAVISCTFLATRSHYIIDLDTLKAQIAQEAKDSQKAADQENITNNYQTKEAYDHLQSQVTELRSSNDDLSRRLQHTSPGSPVILSRPVDSSCKPSNSSSTGSNNSVSPDPAGSAPSEEVSTLDTEILRDDLILLRDHAKALKEIIQLGTAVHAQDQQLQEVNK
jgi:hypothetical protein